jgi:hypothetical protein
MALGNRDRIGRGFETLASGLAPFVDRYMQASPEAGPDWFDRFFRREGRPASKSDPYVVLKAMTDYWEVFQRELGRSARNWANELLETRNAWAHNNTFSVDDTYRALDTMERLLDAIAAGPEAADIRRAKEGLVTHHTAGKGQRRRTQRVPATGLPVRGLPSWRETALPRVEVATGQFAEAEFAADLAQVHRGEGGPEYADPVGFFRRTFLTQGLQALVTQALHRLSRDPRGIPVIGLQTNFGGGKTHSLLSLYHLFSGLELTAFPNELQDVIRIIAGITRLPAAKRAVLVGTAISPSLPLPKDDGTQVRTLWGELAWQLGGRRAYELVADADTTGTNPGDALRILLARHAPCLILIDEWVAYARGLYGVEGLPAGTFDTQLTFAQALTEAVHAVPGTLLVVSIPASDPNSESPPLGSEIEIGGVGGREALRRLRNVVHRVEASWQPASPDESFAIVRRRLFEPFGPEALTVRDAVAQHFVDYYRKHRGYFPHECSDISYEQDIKNAYPIHPELFARLYEDWSTLERFQRTRGVLRLMAKVIHILWAAGDDSPLIMPGGLPLSDRDVETELTTILEDHWKPVLDTDVDGPGSSPAKLDAEKPMFGQQSVARRVSRTVFMGSAPTASSPNRGLEDQRMRLGCATPGESPALFGDALRSLADRATYLYVDRERSWYDVQPSVTRKAADLSERLRQQPDIIRAAIIKRLELASRGEARGAFADVHIAPRTSGEIEDRTETRLVILSPETPHLSKSPSPALTTTAELLDQRGNGPRNYRNMLVFLAPDARRLEDLEQSLSDHLAWTEIVDRAGEFDLSGFQIRQAETRQRQTNEAVELGLMHTYQWLLVPTQPDPIGPIEWIVLRVNGEGSLAERATRKLKEEDLLRLDMAPVLVRMDLDRSLAPLWETGDVEVAQLWDAYARYCYLPRLRDADVLLRAVAAGPAHPEWSKETFAFAAAYDRTTGRYRDLTIGRTASVTMNSVLVQPFLAEAQADLDDHRARSPSSAVATPAATQSTVTSSVVRPLRRKGPRRFRGTVTFRSPQLVQDLRKIEREVLERLGTADDIQVAIHLEMDVSTTSGISEDTASTVMENARALGFEEYGFDE